MVRETRHLWVGNLPDNIREDRIREHFKRYGRVQNVKLLGRTENGNASGASTNPCGAALSSGCGICATVAFMDIKSASKAHNAEHVLDERTLTTEYYEPAAIPSAAGAPSAGSSPAGSGYSGSSSSVNSAPAPASASRYHLSGGEESSGNACAIAATAAAPATWRGTNDSASEYCRRGNTSTAYGRYQRNNSTAPYATPPSNVERTTPHHRWYSSGERVGGATGGESTPSTPGGATEGGGRRRRRSGSGSSRSESSSPEPSDTSRASTPAAPPPHAHHTNHRIAPTHQHQWASTVNGRPLAICVRNLPTRSTDSSLKDGLYHEYKKHGKVVWVKVVGQNADRYAVVRFKKPSDVEKALEVSQDKLFFGCKISVAPHQSCDEDADTAKPYETDIDEYHPKATRTLFIGNLEKDVTQQQLREKFKHFGRIIEIDIKKGSGGGAGYAFCQYASISSVVEAIRAMDGEYVGGSRVKLGFGKPVATTCVWVDGLTEHTEKQVLGAVSRCGTATSVCVDRAAGAALVHFEQAAAAGTAVRELRRVAAQLSAAEPDHPRLCVDYASRECQEAFYEQLEKHGGSAALTGSDRISGDLTTRYLPSTRHEQLRYDGCGSRVRASSYGRSSSRTPRYSAVDHYDPTDYTADRRYRVYDEIGSSPQTEDATYEDRLQSVVVSSSPHRARRHRRDSSPEDRKHSKERHRSSGGSARRSRSGSCGGERHLSRRRHRRRRDGSGSRGSRAGTPLRDELDALPSEPRRPPRERPPLPMSLPLPKFAAQLLRTAPPAPRPAPAPAPASPPRPPSASSSSGGSAPHSPSLEERIRSLDEKYEKWSGSRALADTPDRTRLRHRLLDVDINEVKPSEVVRSLLAKRSVFDEDSERLEGAVRAPSPVGGSPRARPAPCVPRALRYPFPSHPPHSTHTAHPTLPTHTHVPTADNEVDPLDRPTDPRLNRPERIYQLERLGKFNESDYRLESRVRLRTPSTDKLQSDTCERKSSPKADKERSDLDRELKREVKRRNSLYNGREGDIKSLDAEIKDPQVEFGKDDNESQNREKTCLSTLDKRRIGENDCTDDKFSLHAALNIHNETFQEQKISRFDGILKREESYTIDSAELLLKQTEKIHEFIKTEPLLEKESDLSNHYIVKSEFSIKPELSTHDKIVLKSDSEYKLDHNTLQLKSEEDKCKDIFIENHIKVEFNEVQKNLTNKNALESIKPDIDICELKQDLIKCVDDNDKEQYSQNLILDDIANTKLETVEHDKITEKDKYDSNGLNTEDKHEDNEKSQEDRVKCDKARQHKERSEKDKHEHERDRPKKNADKNEKDKKLKEDNNEKLHLDKSKPERDVERIHKDKTERDYDKTKHEEKSVRHDHHKRDKFDKEKRKDSTEIDLSSKKKDEKCKHDRLKKDNGDSKRDSKKDTDSLKIRKSSRDETTRDLCRKDSTDSSTSRASHDSIRLKDLEHNDIKEECKSKLKSIDFLNKYKPEKECAPPKSTDITKFEDISKMKCEVKLDHSEHHLKSKTDSAEHTVKSKGEITEKQRHYSLDSPNLESKRKERLNSSSSLPSHIGNKRRMSFQDSLDSLNEDIKKSRNETKYSDRKDSKDFRSVERHKTTKFNKGHFAKIIESKTKDDKKNQVKPPDDSSLNEWKEDDMRDRALDKAKPLKKSPKHDNEKINSDIQSECLQKDFDFLATLELRSSEEDERQRALRKEMKEKKRIQQLQQIQELQMQQDALQQAAELINKLKDDKKQKIDEKKKESVREKRMSTDRKSKDEKEKNDNNRRKNRKQTQTSDSSDSDEPKKHSIFDIIDDEPTYISMYDKVKARSCKNMQKQEEEKRQEKIKAKFSQLKQSRAKREEKKRSSWDEDSESDHERRKAHKLSMDTSSDDEQIVIHSKKREKTHGSIDYDRSKANEYLNTCNIEDDSRNKLSRKNSRTRIMSDTSDDDTVKRCTSKSPSFLSEIKNENFSDSENLRPIRDDIMTIKESSGDKIKKDSLLNLFGKSDSDDNKLKSNLVIDNDYKTSLVKTITNDYSSENESTTSNKLSGEVRKKHKKKQKKHKFSFSEEETKIEISEAILQEGENKHKHSDKARRHSSKKDKRRDKARESIDADDLRDIHAKKNKKIVSNCFDITTDASNTKKEGKMEDIFGPLSDESDKETKTVQNKLDFSSHDYESTFQSNTINTSEEIKLKDKEDNKRKKEKRRKEKRHFIKEDDNSLDVDAVSKAIEARLFADTLTDDENRTKLDSVNDNDLKTQENEMKYSENDLILESINIGDKNNDKLRKECKEKKKKKKKNKEDRQNRKEHHHSHHNEKIDKTEHFITENTDVELTTKTLLLDIPLPNDTQLVDMNDRQSESKSLSESPSLPRLTDSPPNLIHTSEDIDLHKSRDTDESGSLIIVDSISKTDIDSKNAVEVEEIPMPPPIENIVQNISEVPLPRDPVPSKIDDDKVDTFMPSFDCDIDISENAVRSISNMEKETEKSITKTEAQVSDADDKLDEKPRAIISQEETEDAVAALLGESFGRKPNVFQNCYEENENNTTHQIEASVIENQNIPEEDAEEMRRAVQNLNASELEMKPDTPVSDNDLLLIDTDTEETDETPQDAIERLPINIIATNQSLNNNPDHNKSCEVSNTGVLKSTTNIVKVLTSEPNQPNIKLNETEIKFTQVKHDSSTVPLSTSTVTPVITSWSLSNNKLLEPHVVNIQPNKVANREENESKQTHITANIVQIKAPQHQNIQLSNTPRPIITSNRVSAPYQVINHMIRPQVPNMQAPTIKIPDPQILYQKPQGIVISPRMTNDIRLQSPKASPQGEAITSPRVANMTILSTSTQNLNVGGLASPNSIQQRSPSQVTVVRMQQPPLSPIQAMHIPHGSRTMLSPSRSNSVLVQTQSSPLHFNRLPVTPVLAPISKHMNSNNLVQQNKGTIGANSPLLHPQKIVTSDCRKNERNITENENSKIILSSTSLQQSTNPTVMAQNRLISMQNAMHTGNINSTLHLSNKVFINNISQLSDKRENQIQKSEHHSHGPFGSTPILHVTGVNHTSASIIQSGTKPIMCTLQEANSINRGQGSNVIHTLNSQRLLTTAPISNVIQLDTNKASPSVLSMATIRTPTILTKSGSLGVTTTSLTNVVMTPLLLKNSTASGTVRLSTKTEVDHIESHSPLIMQNNSREKEELEGKNSPPKISPVFNHIDTIDKQKDILIKPAMSPEHTTKCETDFEELLKDNTNQIKVTKDPKKKLEVNVGKSVTLFSTGTQCNEMNMSSNCLKRDDSETNICISQSAPNASDNQESSVLNVQRNENIKDVNESAEQSTNEAVLVDVTKESVTFSKESSADTCIESDKSLETISSNIAEDQKLTSLLQSSDNNDSQLKSLNDENDSWSAKDVNIESVIKKVDSLCNENYDHNERTDKDSPNKSNEIKNTVDVDLNHLNNLNAESNSSKSMDIDLQIGNVTESNPVDEFSSDKIVSVSRRGGRNVRGKKSEKNQDKVQTRQISKLSRGTTSAKRGRGRAKVDRKIKNAINNSTNNMPGDVYDFHEDSGDESTSPNKTETRPRLILTIKSPLSGHSNATPTSTLSITQKEQPKGTEKTNKEEKTEDFITPPQNTRKSRRLQEKDVQRSTVDDVIEDVIKGSHIRTGKDMNKRRPTRQAGTKANQDRTSGCDTRKSPRGVKRTRDRSLSDASLDSSDEKTKKEDPSKESKVPKLTESIPVAKVEAEPALTTRPVVPLANNPPPTPTPITKPPKKMISEISAKLACAFETAASAVPVRSVASPSVTERAVEQQADKAPQEADKHASLREPRNPEVASAAPTAPDVAGSASEPRADPVSTELRFSRRPLDSVPLNMMPVGATEATDARVQSPALPHRPPSTHRPADRATPVLMRAGEGEAGVGAGGAGGSRGARGAGPYAGTASLPRGAHHPPPHHHHHVLKQIAVVSPHHHHQHPGAASRVTITSVPTISPQGQMALSAELVRSPPPAHQQTSPVTPVYHNGEGMYPHFSHQHYQMYQQHFRATQHESRTTPSPYTRSLEAEGSEAPTPPLELRRPPSARVPRPAHSPSPADRHIMYAVGCGRSPPPAHGTSRLPAALPPPAAPGPPHASQVPREADSLQMLLRRYPVMWQGLLALKNDSAAVQMHFVGGNPGVAGDTLPPHTDGSTPPLRIAQRMRLEPTQLDQVHRKMKMENEHCILLALPCGRDHMDVLQQSTNLTGGFINYLQRKQAAGIINVAPPGHQQAMYTVHIFPSCDFANENLNRIAPDLMHRVADIAHLLIVIATV